MVWRWWRRRRRGGSLTEEQRLALKRLVAEPRFELIPLRTAPEKAASLPDGSAVTVTASPSHGIEATFDLAEVVGTMGHEVTPHLSAHMIRDAVHLAELLDRARVAGFRSAFVVGGDARDRGEFHDGMMLLRAIHELGNPFETIGVPAYPQGHTDIADDVLLRSLIDKQPLVQHVSTQMCFEPDAVASWIRRIRAAGVSLPIHIGVPGVAELTKLMTIAARIGVADSARYLKKNRAMVGRLMMSGSFGPDAFLRSLAPSLSDPAADVRMLHIFTFNQVEATVQWQTQMLEELDALPTG